VDLIFGGFDALRVCTFKHNETQAGFKAHELRHLDLWKWAGAFVLEDLETALSRGTNLC
jgi:hypothetical protein